jgi:DNA repair protein RecN (Recombination protein N)
MLTELYIENFALIDRLTVSFAPGLNILTGETGAGKSIVIDAINVLLGERAGTDLIRTGTTRAVLQATFDIGADTRLLTALEEIGVTPEDGMIILARELAREGRSVARINGRSTPVSIVRQVGDLLVDLHGQHEHQSLLREEHHLAFLDALGDDRFVQLQVEVAALARERSALLREWHVLQTDERDRLRAIDLLSFQLEEIANAQLTAGEEEEQATERTRLVNAEKLHEAASAAYQLLHEGEEGRSVLDALGDVQTRLANLLRYDATLEPLVNALDAATVQISDTAYELADYRDRTQFDPERLAEVDERLTLIGNLKRKYGESITTILAYQHEKQAELERLTHHEERRDEILADTARIETKLATRALALSAARHQLADHLAAGVQAELMQLGMPKAVFQVAIHRQPLSDGLLIEGERLAVSTQGIDQVAFYISANAGEPPKPLAKVASGGELSRVMLALKAVSARGAGVPTLIFDEIDTGIGGRTAEAVGAKLAQVARMAQVISVTHLAQLAYYADKHFLLEKTTTDERTNSTMRELTYEERIEELARLQAGGRISPAVLEHIRTVLDEIHTQKSGSLF